MRFCTNHATIHTCYEDFFCLLECFVTPLTTNDLSSFYTLLNMKIWLGESKKHNKYKRLLIVLLG